MSERLGFFTDTSVCIGCKACEVACKQWNDLPADGGELLPGGSYDSTRSLGASTWRHVRFVESDGGWSFMSDVCKHCTHAGCLDACPTGALIRTDNETVVLQPDVCNGCGYCVTACPFGVLGREPEDGRAAKCTLCWDRTQDGLEPACAKACPTDSIQFGALDDLVERAERRVAELHNRGRDEAYLYGTGEETAGGLGAFFLLTEEPEAFGLPASADSPIRQNVVPATIASMGAGLLAAAGVAAAFVAGRRR